MLLKDRVVSVESLCLEMGKILIVEVRGEICQGRCKCSLAGSNEVENLLTVIALHTAKIQLACIWLRYTSSPHLHSGQHLARI